MVSDDRQSSPTQAKAIVNPAYTPVPHDPQGYKSFEAFYPFYLGEHSNTICRRLHLFGTSISFLVLSRVALSTIPRVDSLRLAAPTWKYLLGAMLQAYFFAWLGHFFFERNKPATFKDPLFSLRGDFKLWWEVATLKRKP